MRPSGKQLLVATAAAIAMVAAAAVYYTFDPSGGSRWFPRCPFLLLTGWQCPGCGSQRAIHALLHGRLATAWHHNALLVLSLPYLALYPLALLLRHRHPALYNALNSLTAIIIALATITTWWLLRNLW